MCARRAVNGPTLARFLFALFALVQPICLSADLLEQQRRLEILAMKVPENLNYSRSVRGRSFQLSYEPEGERAKIPVGEMHTWRLALLKPTGQPVKRAKIRVEGMMPQHSHPLSTLPTVKELSSGFYRVSGMKFHMPGWWVVTFKVEADGRTDEISFNLLLGDRTDTGTASEHFWSEAEKGVLRDLWIGSLRELTTGDFPDNPYAFNPDAREFGRLLFNDRSLSHDGKNACASCHLEDRAMAGPHIVDVAGHGPRKPPSLLGAAWQSWFFWDGRKDSLWSQALGPIENPNEIGMPRAKWRKAVTRKYGTQYRTVFGKVPPQGKRGTDEFFVNTAKAIAAYETTLRPAASAFDRYVEKTLGLTPVAGFPQAEFNDCALGGLRTFIGKGRCINCHHGPRFENGSFHATGVQPVSPTDSRGGRHRGIELARKDPFNCHSRFGPKAGIRPRAEGLCDELDHALQGTPLIGDAFKTPTLRNVELTSPYMHNGRLPTLEDVVGHYVKAFAPPGGSELLPLALNEDERKGLVCFLKSLTGEKASAAGNQMSEHSH